MKIVLTEQVASLGVPGDVREVKDGYARNYLLPKGLAVRATARELNKADSRRQVALSQHAKLIESLTELAKVLEEETVTVTARVGPRGRLYGSVSAPIIAEVLSARVGQLIDHRTIELDEPLRVLGTFPVRVRLAPEVVPSVSVTIVGEGGETAADFAVPEPEAVEGQATEWEAEEKPGVSTTEEQEPRAE